MPRYLEVWLHGQNVGWLCEAGRTTRFIATDRYLTDTRRATLSLSMTVPGNEQLTQEALQNHFDPAKYRERGELPSFFAGLMPEGPLRGRLASTRRNNRDLDDFGILAAAGEDLPGAVSVVPANLGHLPNAARISGDDNLQIDVPEGAADGAASLSGVKDKLALSRTEDGKQYRIPDNGQLSDVVAKLPAPGDDTQVMNEHACMRLAGLAGVNVAKCWPASMSAMTDHPEMVSAFGSDTRFLAVKRFDRGINGAIHMEDGCQLLTLMPNEKYSGINQFIKLLQVLDRLSTRGIEDVRQFFIRLTVNTLIGNSDAHLKNFSVLYPNGISPELSPAYDIICVSALVGFQGFSANVAIDASQRKETVETYTAIAKKAGISERIAKAAVMQTIALAKECWPMALREMDVPNTVHREIVGRLNTLPLAVGTRF